MNNVTIIIDTREMKDGEQSTMSLVTDEQALRTLGIKELSKVYRVQGSLMRDCGMRDLYKVSSMICKSDFYHALNVLLEDTLIEDSTQNFPLNCLLALTHY